VDWDEWLESDLKPTFGTGFTGDLAVCPACDGAAQITARIEDPVVIQTILDRPKTKKETCERFSLPESWASPGAPFG